MLKILEVPDKAALEAFVQDLYASVDASDLESFSEKLIAAHKEGRNLVAEVQDNAMRSAKFLTLVEHPMWKQIAAGVLDCPAEEVLIVFPHLRIDLPTDFKFDEKKMSLPWHQEAGYYLEKGNCSRESIVLSTYLHDCDADHGALIVASQTEQDVLSHSRRYMDETAKRFMRVEVEEPESFEIAETGFGQTVVFDFLRRHRSGVNKSGKVRITFLLRAGSKTDIENYASRSGKIN